MQSWIDLAEHGLIPDRLLRVGIRRMLDAALTSSVPPNPETHREEQRRFIREMTAGPVAVETDAANTQHYEVASEFFETVLGPRLKYSSCIWPEGITDLAAAEEAMLELTCERAEIEDGQQVLELGCGWGSVCLWIAEKHPHCRVTAVSNSRSQRSFILKRAAERGLDNLDVITANIASFQTHKQFDRVVSVEMFEHVRNHQELLRRISTWLLPAGKLFVHIFTHRHTSYLFETEGENNWMGRHFFTGGMMPADDLLLNYQRDLVLEDHWAVSGAHYSRTLEAWLQRCDAAKDRLLPLFQDSPDDPQAARRLQRWRMFFMGCSEVFGHRHGRIWGVSHYRFINR